MITAEQIRAARALLDWSTADLAKQSNLTVNGINKIERGHVQAQRETLATLQKMFEAAGVEFIRDIGVQWSQHHVRTLTGVEGLKTFFDDVRYVAQNSDQEIVICGVVEEYLERKLGDFINYQRKEMAAFKNLRMRCLIEENDFSLGASTYCRYRWLSKEYFSNVPFYIYGDKMAVIVTSGAEDPLILLVHNRTIASAYRRQFEAMWSMAYDAPEKVGKT
ncbi:MAG: helix-turn-helix domain-containing protein [Pseudomonadota bacterium]|nr:helix-turn-helix domain-containing protein [Pseudomonadota bacterium]